MKDYMESRVLEFARLMIENKCTVRDIAKISNVSKSTVHKDLSERLRELDINLWEEVRVVLEENFEEKHIRGGESTQLKYRKKKEV